MTDAPSSPPPSSNSNALAVRRQQSKDPPGSYRSNTSYGRQFNFVPDDVSVELNLWQQGESQRRAASVIDRLEKIRNNAIPKLDETKEESSKIPTSTSAGVGIVDDLSSGKNEERKKPIISTINKEEIPIKDNKDTAKNNNIEIDVDDLDDLAALAELDVDDWAEILDQSIKDEEERRNSVNANTTSVTNDTSAAKKEIDECSTLSAPLALLNLEEYPDTQQTSDSLDATNLEAAQSWLPTISDDIQPLGNEKEEYPDTQQTSDSLETTNIEAAQSGLPTISDDSQPLVNEKEEYPDTEQTSDSLEATNLEATQSWLPTTRSDDFEPPGDEKSNLETQECRDEADVAEAAAKVSESTSPQEEKYIDTNDNNSFFKRVDNKHDKLEADVAEEAAKVSQSTSSQEEKDIDTNNKAAPVGFFERVDNKHDKLDALAAQSCKDSASMLLEAGNIEGAKRTCQKWLEIVQNRYGPNSKEVAQFYLEQGRLVIQGGNPIGALESYKKSLELFHGLPGESSRVEVAQCTWNIGAALNATGEKSRALVAFNECLEMEESLMGEHHESLAETHRSIFNLSRELGDKLESIRSGMKALVILKLHLGGDHPRTVQAHQELFSYLEEAGMSVRDVISLALIGKLSLDEIQFAFSSNGLDDDNDNGEGKVRGDEEENQEDASGDDDNDEDDKDENITAEDDNDKDEKGGNGDAWQSEESSP